MRNKLTDILTSYVEYNSFDEFRNVLTLDFCSDFDKDTGVTLDELEEVGVVEFVKEMLEYHGPLSLTSSIRTVTKHDYVMSFDEFIKEGVSPKTQSYMGKLDNCTLDDDELDEEE